MTNESIATSFDAWLSDPMTHWSGDKDAAYQAWLHVHETVVAGLKAECEGLRKAVRFAVEQFETQSSADGSGHGDIARAVLRIAGAAMGQGGQSNG